MDAVAKYGDQYPQFLRQTVEKGLALYNAMRGEVEARRGEYVHINVQTGERVFGRTELEALDAFDERFGEDAPGFLQLIE